MKTNYVSMEAFRIHFNSQEQIAASACSKAIKADASKYQYSAWIGLCNETLAAAMGKYGDPDYLDTLSCVIRGDGDINQYYQ